MYKPDLFRLRLSLGQLLTEIQRPELNKDRVISIYHDLYDAIDSIEKHGTILCKGCQKEAPLPESEYCYQCTIESDEKIEDLWPDRAEGESVEEA